MDNTQPQQKLMPHRNNTVSKAYVKAAKNNIVAQIMGVILGLTIMDGGVILSLWIISCFGYWVGFFFVRLRRSASLSKFDLLFLHFGMAVLFSGTLLLAVMIGYIFMKK